MHTDVEVVTIKFAGNRIEGNTVTAELHNRLESLDGPGELFRFIDTENALETSLCEI